MLFEYLPGTPPNVQYLLQLLKLREPKHMLVQVVPIVLFRSVVLKLGLLLAKQGLLTLQGCVARIQPRPTELVGIVEGVRMIQHLLLVDIDVDVRIGELKFLEDLP